ncbi:complement C1q domain-containing protein [Lacihabitans soyangensis]|nr:complement C1q domain-containing protein [Lacihabitans soyangensis]
MKKLFFILLIFPIIGYSQVNTLPNSIGIGQNTNTAVPLHINKPGEVARFQGASPYVTFYDALNFKGYIQVIGDHLEIGSKNNHNIDFYTNNLPQFRIDGTSGQITAFQKINANNGIRLSGPLQAENESVGPAGSVLVSRGNATPAWEDQKVGFEANGNIAGYNNNTETILSGFASVSFNFGNGFNTSSGVFTAPTPGVYTFNLKLDIGITPSETSLNPSIIRMFKNGSQWKTTHYLFSTDNGYGNNIETKYIINLNQNDTVHFSFFQVSGASLNIRPSIIGFKVL